MRKSVCAILLFLVALAIGIFSMLSGKPATKRVLYISHKAEVTAPSKSDVVATNLPKFIEQISIEELLAGKWFLVLRDYIKSKNLAVKPEVQRKIGLALGDHELFWQAIESSCLPETYLRKYISVMNHSNKLWRFVKNWPKLNFSGLRFNYTLLEWLRRPVRSSFKSVIDSILAGCPGSLYPENFIEFLGKEFDQIASIRFFPFLPLIYQSSSKAMISAATLKNMGWSWCELSLIIEPPEKYRNIAIQWYVESCFPENAVTALGPFDKLYSRELQDAVLASKSKLNNVIRFKTTALGAFKNWKKSLQLPILPENMTARRAFKYFFHADLFKLDIYCFVKESPANGYEKPGRVVVIK